MNKIHCVDINIYPPQNHITIWVHRGSGAKPKRYTGGMYHSIERRARRLDRGQRMQQAFLRREYQSR